MLQKRIVPILFVTMTIALITSSVATSLLAEEKFTTELIPREVLFGNPERADPQISPDGTQLGYLAPVNGVLNVWIRTLGKDDDRAVTDDKKRGIRNFTWQYDNQHILYVQDVGGDENWRLYQTDIATKQTKDLTPFEKVRVDLVAYDWKTARHGADPGEQARSQAVRCAAGGFEDRQSRHGHGEPWRCTGMAVGQRTAGARRAGANR